MRIPNNQSVSLQTAVPICVCGPGALDDSSMSDGAGSTDAGAHATGRPATASNANADASDSLNDGSTNARIASTTRNASKQDGSEDHATTDTTPELVLTVSLFELGIPKESGPAYGMMKEMTWAAFTRLFQPRRDGAKDGPNFIPATFRREPDGRVRRISANLMARTALALDIESNKGTGEIPPPFEEAVERTKAMGWAAIVYTSHSHTAALPRFRIVLPLSTEIDFKLPAVKVIANHLDLSGVLDTGKLGAASLFYFPSAESGQLAHHQTEVIHGAPIDTAWITERAGAILAAREAEQERQRALALEAVAKRREERIAQGFDPERSVIEAVRDRLDLAGELVSHGYLPVQGRHDLFLYSGSETRVPGVHILTGRDGVERVYSHHSGDPLAPGNLPPWCSVRAIDAVDVKVILDFRGDRKAALRSLAQKFCIQNPRRAAAAPGPNGCDHDDGARGDEHRIAGDGDPADEPRPRPDDTTEPAGVNRHEDPAGAQAEDDEEPVDPTDAEHPGKDYAGAAASSESEYARILKIIMSATPKSVVDRLINALLQSDLTPTDEIRLIKITSVQSDDGEARATIPAINRQLRQERGRLARDNAGAENKARQQAEHEAQQRGRGAAPPPDPVADVIAEFNERYFVANEGGRAMIWEPTRDPMLNNRIYYQRSKPLDLRIFYMNRMVQIGETKEGEPVLHNAADVWLKHPNRAQYIHGIVFDPSGKERPGVYNLWRSFAVGPKGGSWRKMQDHLLIVVCTGKEKHYRYLRKLLARMVQFPAKQGEVAIVLRGLEGAGKSILGDAMRRIFGQHGFAISNPVHLAGKFNAHLRDCVMLFADEAFFPNDRHHVSVLKALITQPYLTIEGKGENIVLAPNFVHLLMASNADWVVPASLDARRFFVRDLLATHVGDRPYFKALWNELENGGLEAMLHDLLLEDLTDFDHRDVPDTIGLQQQKKLSLPVQHQWYQEVLHRGFVWQSKLGLENVFGEWMPAVSTELLYASYVDFSKERRVQERLSREDFGTFMRNMNGKPTRPAKLIVGEHRVDCAPARLRAEVVYKQNARGYYLGDLSEARAGFLIATNLTVDWEPEPAEA